VYKRPGLAVGGGPPHAWGGGHHPRSGCWPEGTLHSSKPLDSYVMSRKGKKKGRGAKFRPPVRAAGTPGAPGQPLTQRSVSQARVGGDQATVRAVEMSLGTRNQVVKGRGGQRVIESGDPAIPLDRVPYFTKDLVRLGVVGAAMLVLLAAGSIAVPIIVK
jgi:hypothetical protein